MFIFCTQLRLIISPTTSTCNLWYSKHAACSCCGHTFGACIGFVWPCHPDSIPHDVTHNSQHANCLSFPPYNKRGKMRTSSVAIANRERNKSIQGLPVFSAEQYLRRRLITIIGKTRRRKRGEYHDTIKSGTSGLMEGMACIMPKAQCASIGLPTATLQRNCKLPIQCVQPVVKRVFKTGCGASCTYRSAHSRCFQPPNPKDAPRSGNTP